ncbi:hypothetical protein [Paenibacillus kyungheensis]
MEERFIVRISSEEKQQLNLIADELQLSLSALARKRLLGEDTSTTYFELISKKINLVSEGEVFTLKKLIPLHWQYLSRPEKKCLVKMLLEAIDEDELPVDLYRVTKRGKYKFVRTGEYFSSDIFQKFLQEAKHPETLY